MKIPNIRFRKCCFRFRIFASVITYISDVNQRTLSQCYQQILYLMRTRLGHAFRLRLSLLINPCTWVSSISRPGFSPVEPRQPLRSCRWSAPAGTTSYTRRELWSAGWPKWGVIPICCARYRFVWHLPWEWTRQRTLLNFGLKCACCGKLGAQHLMPMHLRHVALVDLCSFSLTRVIKSTWALLDLRSPRWIPHSQSFLCPQATPLKYAILKVRHSAIYQKLDHDFRFKGILIFCDLPPGIIQLWLCFWGRKQNFS